MGFLTKVDEWKNPSDELETKTTFEVSLGGAAMRDRVAVHPVIDEFGGRRIAIYRRPDGCFVYAEEVRGCWGGDDEATWSSEYDHTPSGIYDSIETALREAERDIPWLRERLPKTTEP
jgi:hypothetical protein